MAPTPPINLGFLTVLQEGNAYLGGYLVTNSWGRPLEFRLSTAVQPNRVHQILYAATLGPYVCADLIGKTLVDKSAVAAQLLVTDTEAMLELRHRVEVPVVWVAAPPPEAVRTHARYPDDAAAVRDVLARLEGIVDLTEPFTRIREAIGEARKMGVAGRS